MDLAFAPAVELLAKLRARDVSARELTELYLGRIERLNPQLNAVVTLDAEGALARANELDRKREPGGWLHGLPITIKDQFETAGLRTTCGAELYKDYVPKQNAAAVQRLVDAGAIVLGKTNLPAFAGDWQTYNDLFGTTNNPWDLSRTPGGSSGGSAAAVAAGLSALELGGDIGGSIRNPAAWCGVFGHKSSWGIIPFRGTLPAPPGTLSRTDVAAPGPIARSAEDLDLALNVLAAPDEWDTEAWRLELPPPRHQRIADYRIAVWIEDERYPIAADLQEAFAAVAESLVALGARVEYAHPDVDLDELRMLRQQLVYPILALGLEEEAFAAEVERGRTLDPELDTYEARRTRGAVQTHREWLRTNERRAQVRGEWARFFRDWDVCLVPPTPTVAIPHDHAEQAERTFELDGKQRPYWELGGWISLAGVAYLPSTVAPVGRSPEGLPIGVEIVGPYLEDRTGIFVAREIGIYEPPPLVD